MKFKTWTIQFKISILMKYKTNLKRKRCVLLKIFLLFSYSLTHPLHGGILKRHPETSRAFQRPTDPWSRLTPRKCPKLSHGYLSPDRCWVLCLQRTPRVPSPWLFLPFKKSPLGSPFCSRPSNLPISHSLTPIVGFNYVHNAVPPSQAHCLIA